MEGVVYFGVNSVNFDAWHSPEDIDVSLNQILEFRQMANSSGFASFCVPNNWYIAQLSSKSLIEIIQDLPDKQMTAHFFKKFFDVAFNSSISKDLNFSDCFRHLKNENPSDEPLEYYGACKLYDFWPGIPEDIHVTDEQDLNNWAQKFLTEHPFNENNYTKRCQKIFSNLVFHSNFSETLKGHGTVSNKSKYGKAQVTGINGFSESVTKVLSVLNSIDIQSKIPKDILPEIQAKSGFGCTSQGNNKAHLKFDYELEDGSVQKILCEYHVKINVNNGNDGVFYHDRVYFGFMKSDDMKKIFVAHSGKHL